MVFQCIFRTDFHRYLSRQLYLIVLFFNNSIVAPRGCGGSFTREAEDRTRRCGDAETGRGERQNREKGQGKEIPARAGARLPCGGSPRERSKAPIMRLAFPGGWPAWAIVVYRKHSLNQYVAGVTVNSRPVVESSMAQRDDCATGTSNSIGRDWIWEFGKRSAKRGIWLRMQPERWAPV